MRQTSWLSSCSFQNIKKNNNKQTQLPSTPVKLCSRIGGNERVTIIHDVTARPTRARSASWTQRNGQSINLRIEMQVPLSSSRTEWYCRLLLQWLTTTTDGSGTSFWTTTKSTLIMLFWWNTCKEKKQPLF